MNKPVVLTSKPLSHHPPLASGRALCFQQSPRVTSVSFYGRRVFSQELLLDYSSLRAPVLPLSVMCHASHFASFMSHSLFSFFAPLGPGFLFAPILSDKYVYLDQIKSNDIQPQKKKTKKKKTFPPSSSAEVNCSMRDPVTFESEL